MTAFVKPPRVEGLRTLGPELTRIVDALARVQEEKDHWSTKRAERDEPQLQQDPGK